MRRLYKNRQANYLEILLIHSSDLLLNLVGAAIAQTSGVKVGSGRYLVVLALMSFRS